MKKENRKRLNGLFRGIKIVAFGAVLLIMAFIGLLWFARPDTSELEKRTLTPFPSITLSGLWDGSFFSQVDTWYADTYPLREGLIAGSKWMENHYGTRGEQLVGDVQVADTIPTEGGSYEEMEEDLEDDSLPDEPEAVTLPDTEGLEDGTITETGDFQGSIYITGNAGYGFYYFSESGAKTIAKTFNTTYKQVKDKVNMYVLICPQSGGVMLDEDIVNSLGASDENAAINYVDSLLNPGIHGVNPFPNLKAHNAEYIYFRTDHHWTALGAYYAYQSFCVEKGIQYHDLDYFETREYPDFIGTLYSKSNKSSVLAENPDTVIAYVPHGTNSMHLQEESGAECDWNIISDASNYSSNNKYIAFVAGDQPFSYAHNPEITDGSACLVIKDSFGNSFIPFLVDHYEYVYWIDFRTTKNTISQMADDYGIQDVIYCLSIYNGASSGASNLLAKVGQ
ncbi:MAG: DHHW family protein [Oscillospiraceae bacterium]|nr:DHHW family protein [Oscillospiraceae bacterium]